MSTRLPFSEIERVNVEIAKLRERADEAEQPVRFGGGTSFSGDVQTMYILCYTSEENLNRAKYFFGDKSSDIPIRYRILNN
jgi:hypothetical protein